MLPLLLLGCGAEPEPLDDVQRAVRASLMLRGHRPTEPEVDALRARATTVDQLAASWVRQPAFAETVADWHAEFLLLRHDTMAPLPPIGVLEGTEGQELIEALTESPLRLIAHQVEMGTPVSEWFAGRDTATNAAGARLWGLPYDDTGPDWQITQWPSDVPAAGLLADHGLWMRHISSDTNHHRTRANLIHTAWLCEDLAQRTLEIGTLDLADPVAVSTALQTDPACAGCHEVLDPVAAALAGFDRYVLPAEITEAMEGGCIDSDPHCYPIDLYRPDTLADHTAMDLPSPALGGVEVDGLEGLGSALVADPRFAPCMARRWLSYSRQQPLDEVSPADVVELAEVFVASGHDIATLAWASVSGHKLNTVPSQHVRPEATARDVERLTGFRWLADPDGGQCEGELCWGAVDLGLHARWGFRDMAGGIDATASVHPVHSPSTMGHLTTARLAELAADHVVRNDFQAAPSGRLLLTEIEPLDTEVESVTRQIMVLHRRILAEHTDDSDPGIAETVGLWQRVHQSTQDSHEAWRAVIAALLQAPERRVY